MITPQDLLKIQNEYNDSNILGYIWFHRLLCNNYQITIKIPVLSFSWKKHLQKPYDWDGHFFSSM